MTTPPSTSSLTVGVEAEPPTDWDPFLAGAAGATFCHLGAWGGVMEAALGAESLHVTARDEGGVLEGVLPLVRVKSRLFGHYLVSMPFLNYGGPVGSARARHALTTWASGTAAHDRVDLLELRWREAALTADAVGAEGATGPNLPAGFEITRRKVTVLLPLPESAEELWEKGLKAKLRSQIRRPMKENYTVHMGPGEIDAFYEVFARNMRDLGTPVLPKGLFRRLPGAFGDDVIFATVYDGDTAIAAGCGFHFGDEFEITWASSVREYNRTAPNMLLYWRMMEASIERGAKVYNFGRCTPGGGTHRFKKQWGGTDESLPWAAWSAGGSAVTPNPDQGKYQIATRVWSRLPVPVTRIVGPPLARRIP